MDQNETEEACSEDLDEDQKREVILKKFQVIKRRFNALRKMLMKIEDDEIYNDDLLSNLGILKGNVHAKNLEIEAMKKNLEHSLNIAQMDIINKTRSIHAEIANVQEEREPGETTFLHHQFIRSDLEENKRLVSSCIKRSTDRATELRHKIADKTEQLKKYVKYNEDSIALVREKLAGAKKRLLEKEKESEEENSSGQLDSELPS